jgi:ATP-dependent DNA ligase I
VLLADLVATADAVASTGSRNAKVGLIADILRRLEPSEVAPAVGFLSGVPRQRKIGVGWATVWRLEVEPSTQPSLTVADLDAALGKIQRTTGPGSALRRTQILTDLLSRATAAEIDFVRRLMVGELRQGALEGVMTDAVAKASDVPTTRVRRALMLGGDLGKTAELAVTRGAEGLETVGLSLMTPVLPMLASIADDVGGAIGTTGPASVEWKLDGIRIQVHKRGNEVRVFTRNLNDITNRVPEIVEIARALPSREVVLDGEAIGLDEEQRPYLFQDTMSRVGRSGEWTLSLACSFFDCLHVEGDDLLDRPLGERLTALARIAKPWRVPAIITEDAEEAARFLDDAVAAGHEGVMVKAMSSTYQSGRRGRAWIKVKPVRTLDLVVLGAEWGHGRRRGWLSNLHLGARDPAGGFVMVGKTFKGLTDETLRWQTQALLDLERAREGIVVFVRPELVVEIELDGVQTSTRYAGGVALRFARVLRYRPDKDPQEADTIDAVRAMLARKP